GGIDARIDDEVRHMDPPRPDLARTRLRQRPQAELRAGEGGVAHAPAQAGRRAGEEVRAASARQHVARGLPPGKEGGEARHLPDLAEHPRGGLEDGKVDVRADVEDAYLEGRRGLGLAEEGGDVVLVARVERPAEHTAAGGLDLR